MSAQKGVRGNGVRNSTGKSNVRLDMNEGSAMDDTTGSLARLKARSEEKLMRNEKDRHKPDLLKCEEILRGEIKEVKNGDIIKILHQEKAGIEDLDNQKQAKMFKLALEVLKSTTMTSGDRTGAEILIINNERKRVSEWIQYLISNLKKV
jgi:hypothetical protein